MENIETIVKQLSSLLGIDFVQDVDDTFRGEPATAQTAGAISEGCVITNIGFWLCGRNSQTF